MGTAVASPLRSNFKVWQLVLLGFFSSFCYSIKWIFLFSDVALFMKILGHLMFHFFSCSILCLRPPICILSHVLELQLSWHFWHILSININQLVLKIAGTLFGRALHLLLFIEEDLLKFLWTMARHQISVSCFQHRSLLLWAYDGYLGILALLQHWKWHFRTGSGVMYWVQRSAHSTSEAVASR